MLSPVAVSWMVGKSMLEQRFGPVANLGRWLGWETPTFFSSPEIARLTMMCMDAWTFIPLMIIMLLAGLQALPKEVLEAATNLRKFQNCLENLKRFRKILQSPRKL